MPFLKVKVSCPVFEDQERELKGRIGKAMEQIPGKSEKYLLLEVEEKCHIWLRGENDCSVAYVEAAIFGNERHVGYPAFSALVTDSLQEVLGIDPANCYIRYEDIPAWAVDGQYIDRRMFQ